VARNRGDDRCVWAIRPIAGALFVPYIAWVTFATAPTLAIWQLNR
jgi:tryptophan-rich sensory protein